jgi:hypothetical protein
VERRPTARQRRRHARIAAALAQAIELPGTDDGWMRPLPAAPPCSAVHRLAGELAWSRRHLLPWAWRHLRGRSSGDGRAAKRPELLPLLPEAAS